MKMTKKQERNTNKLLKYNRDVSEKLINDNEHELVVDDAKDAIDKSKSLLSSLGVNIPATSSTKPEARVENKKQDRSFEEIFADADTKYDDELKLEDFLTTEEIDKAIAHKEEIEELFKKKTGIINKNDLIILGIATAIQVTKAILTPYILSKLDYGEKIDTDTRLAHNDKSIEQHHKQMNNEFRDSKLKKGAKKAEWIEMLYRTPAFDTTKGSKDLGINMLGKYHRAKTLGHDPILGWIFGTMNILTDTVTMNNLTTFRVTRNPMRISNSTMSIFELFSESTKKIMEGRLNLPAAVFAEWQHLVSDKNTKVGLPIPLITLNESFESSIYQEGYDWLCLQRDIGLVGKSAVISAVINMLIGLIHSFLRKPDEDKRLYKVRTQKILLISNAIASGSSIIHAVATKNPKNLDLGGLLISVSKLFIDTRFILKVKQEFIDNVINEDIKKEIKRLDLIKEGL